MNVNKYNPSYSAPLQTDNSPATTVPQSKEQYYDIWSAWRNDAPPGGGEMRDIAVNKMRDSLDRRTYHLDLSGLNLSSLPNFIHEEIKELDISSNQLDILPDNLPKNLNTLYGNNNKFIKLPKSLPENLFCLILSQNNLTILPEHLPSSISYIDVSNNKIKSIATHHPSSLTNLNLEKNKLNYLPDNLPTSIEFLDLRDNNLKAFPVAIMNMSPDAEVYLTKKRTPKEIIKKIKLIIKDPVYTGPRIICL